MAPRVSGPGCWPTADSSAQQAAWCLGLHVSTGRVHPYLPQKDWNTVCLPAGFVMPRDRPWYVILPGSHRILWWDALVRWLAVFFFIQIPMDIAFRGQQRLARWYYISVQVTAVMLCGTFTTVLTPCSTSQPLHPPLV